MVTKPFPGLAALHTISGVPAVTAVFTVNITSTGSKGHSSTPTKNEPEAVAVTVVVAEFASIIAPFSYQL